MIGWIARSFPFGVALYWMAFSLISIVESFIIRKMVERQFRRKERCSCSEMILSLSAGFLLSEHIGEM